MLYDQYHHTRILLGSHESVVPTCGKVFVDEDDKCNSTRILCILNQSHSSMGKHNGSRSAKVLYENLWRVLRVYPAKHSKHLEVFLYEGLATAYLDDPAHPHNIVLPIIVS